LTFQFNWNDEGDDATNVKSSGSNDSTITEKSKEDGDFDFEFNNFKWLP